MTRTCVGCRQATASRDLVRLVLTDDGEVAVDLAGRAFGRGAWVHPGSDCVRKAAAHGLGRSFKQPVRTGAKLLVHRIRDAADRRMVALLGAAKAARRVEIGSDAVRQALGSGAARLVLVASDARASAAAPWILEAVARGDAVAWGSKEAVGAALGRGPTAVIAISDRGMARAVREVAQLACLPVAAARRDAPHVSVEV